MDMNEESDDSYQSPSQPSSSSSPSSPQDMNQGAHRSAWDSDEALDSLKMERSVKPDVSNEDLTRQLLEDAAPTAAMSIIHLAMHSTNDNTRLNASRYITDKLLDDQQGATKQKWEDMIGDMISKAEIFSNQEGA